MNLCNLFICCNLYCCVHVRASISRTMDSQTFEISLLTLARALIPFSLWYFWQSLGFLISSLFHVRAEYRCRMSISRFNTINLTGIPYFLFSIIVSNFPATAIGTSPAKLYTVSLFYTFFSLGALLRIFLGSSGIVFRPWYERLLPSEISLFKINFTVFGCVPFALFVFPFGFASVFFIFALVIVGFIPSFLIVINLLSKSYIRLFF